MLCFSARSILLSLEVLITRKWLSNLEISMNSICLLSSKTNKAYVKYTKECRKLNKTLSYIVNLILESKYFKMCHRNLDGVALCLRRT